MLRLPTAVTSCLLLVSLCLRRPLQRCRDRPGPEQPPPACCKLTANTGSARKHLAPWFRMHWALGATAAAAASLYVIMPLSGLPTSAELTAASILLLLLLAALHLENVVCNRWHILACARRNSSSDTQQGGCSQFGSGFAFSPQVGTATPLLLALRERTATAATASMGASYNPTGLPARLPTAAAAAAAPDEATAPSLQTCITFSC